MLEFAHLPICQKTENKLGAIKSFPLSVRAEWAKSFWLKTHFWRDYKNMQAQGINFVREPKTEEYGTVAVFEDLYGNLWDLVEFKK
jgi:uncharacterized glyoxalase superfamily protein PhnB